MISIFHSYTCIGFSGSRKGVARSRMLDAAIAVPPGSRIVVGCAKGVDQFFREYFPTAEVFAVSSRRWGVGRGAFAGRSAACVRAVAAAGGLWVSFPSSPCPAGLLPSRSQSKCFKGTGSGTWSSLAYALGSGVPCLVYLGSLPCPAGWGLAPVPGIFDGWWGCAMALRSPAAPVQLSLF